MKIAVIDAQGAGLGQTIIKKIRKELGDTIYIAALGTNSAAASNMLKAGADISISGEKSICSFINSNQINCLIGPIGAICNGGINGEITPKISKMIFNMHCTKYLLPLQKHGIYIPGTRDLQIKDIIEEIICDIKSNTNSLISPK
jgi:hypothetical protein